MRAIKVNFKVWEIVIVVETRDAHKVSFDSISLFVALTPNANVFLCVKALSTFWPGWDKTIVHSLQMLSEFRG